ncbi:restriction endonuclease subunit S [Mycoplasmopsis pullorum]|nr:restriction endonuclease subunit S [Mycoplasmopsis pullorum]
MIKVLQFIFEKIVVDVPLDFISHIKRGRVISKEEIQKNFGLFPVYSSQTENNGELGKINTYDFDGEFLTWTTDGAKAWTIFYRKGKFSITNVCGLIDVCVDFVSIKYLYYFLTLNMSKYVKRETANAKLMSNVVSNIRISLPSLKIQNKIVKVLDNFESICKDLNVGLPVEEQKRQQQYEYYRDKIFHYLEKLTKK